ncbi:hypothetical protein BJX64DRAFT_283549 [Aspergillus heterothallicus]
MSSEKAANHSNTPKEKSQNQVIKEGGYENSKHFMDCHNLRLYEDDDVQLAKVILSRFNEYDRAHANNDAHEANTGSSSDPDAHSDADLDDYSTAAGIGDDDDDLDGEETVEGHYSYFEWGVDEPEFEGHPSFSDDEADYDDHDDPVDDDYGDDGDYEVGDEDW